MKRRTSSKTSSDGASVLRRLQGGFGFWPPHESEATLKPPMKHPIDVKRTDSNPALSVPPNPPTPSSWISPDSYPKGPQAPVQNPMYHNDTNASVPYDLSILSTLEERQVRCPHFCSIPASLSLSLDWLSKADPPVPFHGSPSLPP